MPKTSGYVKIFKVEEKDNRLMSFRIDDELFGIKLKTQKDIKLNALTVYHDRYITTKIRKYRGKVNSNFRGLNVTEGDMECESFTFIFIDFLLVYKNKYYLQAYLDHCVYKIVRQPNDRLSS